MPKNSQEAKVGRTVLFVDPSLSSEPLPAKVLRAFPRDPADGSQFVDVKVFGYEVHDAVHRSVPIFDPGQDPKCEHWCEWMPYQHEQAAKVAAADEVAFASAPTLTVGETNSHHQPAA